MMKFANSVSGFPSNDKAASSSACALACVADDFVPEICVNAPVKPPVRPPVSLVASLLPDPGLSTCSAANLIYFF